MQMNVGQTSHSMPFARYAAPLLLLAVRLRLCCLLQMQLSENELVRAVSAAAAAAAAHAPVPVPVPAPVHVPVHVPVHAPVHAAPLLSVAGAISLA